MRQYRWWILLAAVVCVGVAGLARGAGAGDAEPDAGGTVRLAFRERAHVVMHAWARAAIEGGASEPARVEGFGQLVEAGRALEHALGDPRLWGMIDARVARADNAADLVVAFEGLPHESTMRDGSTRAFRDEAVAYAQRLQVTTAAFEADGWADIHATLQGAARETESMLEHAAPNPMDWIIEKMAWRVPRAGIEIPVDLVWQAPSPGGVTFRIPGGAACVVGLDRVEGPARAEVVLHEAMHAVDAIAGSFGGTRGAPEDSGTGAEDALSRLRRVMTADGINPAGRIAHDAWHTLFFVTAGECVRHCIDPAYVDYGVARTYYDRVGPISRAERRAWGAYLRGEMTMDEAIEKIVGRVRDLEKQGE